MKRFALAVAVAISAPAAADTQADVDRLMQWMSGEFSTAQQVAESAEPKPRLRAMFATVLEMPDIPGTTLFVEWRDPDRDSPVSSQRVWTYTPTPEGIDMKFYTLNQKARDTLTGVHSAADPRAAAAKALALSDLNGYPDNCTFHLKKVGEAYEGRNGDGTCVIFNRTLKENMRPNVLIRVTPGRVLEDGTFVYEKADGSTRSERIVGDFRRVK
ncbi:MAG: CpcT/CpeT family chromophore lyase [Rhodospirillaceae bacterium]|nr:CpcT/CpeT family chromophore lyase [Rhodospirillaceae bacterium]